MKSPYICVAAACVLLAGCESHGPVETRKATIGQSIQGRPIDIQVLGNGPEHVLIGATIHGNEWAGTPILEKLLPYLQARPDLLEGKTVTLIPVMNPDGYHFKTRGNANGVDLNRNFPATNRQNTKRYGMSAFSEPESRAWADYITSTTPARMVIMHQPYNQMDWDGPGRPLAIHMAKHTIMPEERVGARPGSMGSHYGVDLNIPIITYELPKDAEKLTPDELWDRYARSLVAAITWPRPIGLARFNSATRWDLLGPLALLGAAVVLLGLGQFAMARVNRPKKPSE